MRALAVSALVLLTTLAGCGAPPDWKEYPLPDWKPGYEWVYVDGDGKNPFVARMLSGDFLYGTRPQWLLSWNHGTEVNYDFAHVVVLEGPLLGRNVRWIEPFTIHCDKTKCADDQIRYEGNGGYTLQILSNFPLRPDVDAGVGVAANFEWHYRGMKAELDQRTHAQGPVDFESPYLGRMKVIRYHYDYRVVDPSPQFADFLKHVPGAGAFNVDAEYSFDAQNLVHAVAHIDQNPEEAWSGGFLFEGNGDNQPAEFWLKSYSLVQTASMSGPELKARWGS